MAGRWESSMMVYLHDSNGCDRQCCGDAGCVVETGGEEVQQKEQPNVVRVDLEEGQAQRECVNGLVGMRGKALLEEGGLTECMVRERERIEGRVTTGTIVVFTLPGQSLGNVTVLVRGLGRRKLRELWCRGCGARHAIFYQGTSLLVSPDG